MANTLEDLFSTQEGVKDSSTTQTSSNNDLSTLFEKQTSSTSKIDPFTSPEGKYNLDVSKYEPYIDKGIFVTSDLDEQRAQNQSNWEKIGKGVANTATGLVFDTLKDTSYLLDWEQVSNLAQGKEQEFTNFFADAMDKAKQSTKLDIYRTQGSLGFHPESVGWWADALPDLATTLSMVIPTTGAIKGLGLAGKALGGAKLLKALGIAGTTVEGISGAVLSRYMENTMEGYQTFQDTYKTAIDKGATEDQAKTIAAEAATNNWQLNSAMLLQDIPQYMTLFKGFKGASALFGGSKAAKIASTVLGESAEEAYQFVTNEETKRAALIKGGLIEDDNKPFSKRMQEYASDGDFWTSAFLGGLGGGIFEGVSVYKDNKEQKKFDATLQMHRGILTGDEKEYNRGQDRAFTDKIIEATANKGGLQNLYNDLQYIKANPERIEDPKEQADIAKNVSSKIEDLEYANTILTKLQFDPTKTPQQKGLEFSTLVNQRTIEKRLVDIRSDLNRVTSQDQLTLEFPQPDLYAYKRTKLTLEGIKGVPKLATKAVELEKSLKEVGSELLKVYPQFKTIQDLEKSLISSNDEQIKSLLKNESIEKLDLKEAKDIIFHLSTEEGKKAFNDVLEKIKQTKEATKPVEKDPEIEALTKKWEEEQKANAASKGELDDLVKQAKELKDLKTEVVKPATKQVPDYQGTPVENKTSLKAIIAKKIRTIQEIRSKLATRHDIIEHLEGLIEDSTSKVESVSKQLVKDLAATSKVKRTSTSLKTKRGQNLVAHQQKLHEEYRRLLVTANDIQNRVKEVQEEIEQLTAIQKDLESQIDYYNSLLGDSTLKRLDREELAARKFKIANKLTALNKVIEKFRNLVSKAFEYLKGLTSHIVKLSKEVENLKTVSGLRFEGSPEVKKIMELEAKGADLGEYGSINYGKLKREFDTINNDLIRLLENGDISEDAYIKKVKQLEDFLDKAVVYQDQIRYLDELLRETITVAITKAGPAPTKKAPTKVTPLSTKKSTKPVVTDEVIVSEDPTIVNKRHVTENVTHAESKSTFDKVKGFIKRAQTWMKTESGTDNDSKPTESRYFRYLERNSVQGNKLIIVTKKINSELYDKLLDDEARLFEKNNPNYKGIYTVLVDENNKPIYSDQNGKRLDKGDHTNMVISTLTLPNRIVKGDIEIKDDKLKDQAIKDLQVLRFNISEITTPVFLKVNGKSKGLSYIAKEGHNAFESPLAGTTERVFKPILGRITNDLKKVILQLPKVIRPVVKNDKTVDKYQLLDGELVDYPKLYAFDDSGRPFDLIPRNLTEAEANLALTLIQQRMHGTPAESKKAGELLNNLMFIGISKQGVNPHTIEFEKGNLILGLPEGGTIAIASSKDISPENRVKLINFLRNKRVHVDRKLLESKKPFQEPYLEDGEIKFNIWPSYKEYLLSDGGEDYREPLFGTDLKPMTETRFRNTYMTYEPTILHESLPEESKEEVVETMDLTPAQLLNPPEDKGRVIKKYTKGVVTESLSLDRLVSKETKDLAPITASEQAWFERNFPNIPIEIVKGLIDGKSFGRFLESGKVLLSDLATKGTLYHEAFHVVTQLYLTKAEIKAIYAEAREKIGKRTDKKIEEILAEDFFDYKETGKILGDSPKRNTIFRRLLNFLKNLVGLNTTSLQSIYEKMDKGVYAHAKQVGTKQFTSLDRPLEDRSTAFTKDVIDGVDFMVSEILSSKGATPDKLFGNKKALKEIFESIRNQFIDKLEEQGEILTNDNSNKKADSLIDAYEYILDNFDKVIAKYLDKNRSLGLKLSFKEATVETSEEGDIEIANDRQGEAYLENNRVSQSETMSKQVKFLIKTLPSLELNALGLHKLVDFPATYNLLLNKLAGLSSYDDMIAKIKELSVANPDLKELVTRLKPSDTTLSLNDKRLQDQFRQDFGKNKATSYVTLIKLDGTIYTIDANKSGLAERIKEKWRNNTRQSSLGTVKPNEKGELVIDQDVLKIEDNVKFLTQLGINLSPETIKLTYRNEEFINAVSGIRQGIGNNPNITDIFSKEGEFIGNINYILELETEGNRDIVELSFINAENKTIYQISLNNAISIISNIINNAKTRDELFDKLPHLNTVYNQNSIYLSNLFDEEGNKLENVKVNLDLLDGLKSEDSEERHSSQTTGLSGADRLVQEFNNLLLYGKTAYIRASDKASEYAVSLSRYVEGKLPVTIESVEEGFNTPEVLNIFEGYFLDELKRIRAYNIDKLGKDIEYYGDSADKTGVNNAGGDWTLFQAILLKPTKDAITDSGILDNIELDENVYNKLLPLIHANIVKYLDEYANGMRKNLLKDNRIGESLDEGKLLGIANDLVKKGYSLDQMVRAFAVNDLINSVEQVKLFIGDMAFYKDLFKRTSGGTGGKKTVNASQSHIDWLNEFYKTNPRKDEKVADGKIQVAIFEDSTQQSDYLAEYIDALVETGMSADQAKNILAAYAKMDEGDAQGWITLDEYREFFIGAGDWSNNHQRIFDKAQSGKMLTEEEMFYFMPIKAQYFGPQTYEGLFAPAYHKFSLMPLIPSLVKDRNLAKLLERMQDQDVGYSLFKSGSKVGTLLKANGKANKFYTSTISGEIDNTRLITQEVNYEFLGIQLDIAPKVKEEVVFGTQFRKLLFSNLFENGKEVFKGAQDLFNEYSKNISDQVVRKKAELIKELGLNPANYTQEDVRKLVDTLVTEAKDRNLADNIIDGLQTETLEGKIVLKYKLDISVNKAKIDSMLMSLVNSRLIRQSVNGDAMIQGASTGFESIGKRKIGSNPKYKFYTNKGSNGTTTSAECGVPMSGQYRFLLDEFRVEGDTEKDTIKRVNQAIADNKISDRILTMVGYRIPTQGLNSIDFLKIKEFFPAESGNLIVLPTEIVAKSGGDYDIDKLNVLRPHLSVKNGKVVYNNDRTSTEGAHNRIIEIGKTILENPYNFRSLISPNSNHLLTDVVKELRYIESGSSSTFEVYTANRKAKAKDLEYTRQLRVDYKLQQFVSLLSGKGGVGIGAIRNTFQTLAQIGNVTLNKFYVDSKGKVVPVDIKFKHNSITVDGEDYINVSAIKDANGVNDISEVISQLITSHLDVAKDAFIEYLNITPETFGTVAYLVSTGVDINTILYFMKQPIMTDYLKAKSINDSIFIKVAGKKVHKTPDVLRNEVSTKYLRLLKENDTVELNIPFDGKDINKEFKSYLVRENQSTDRFALVQLQVLSDFLEYQAQSRLLSEALNTVSYDTHGQGANIGASHDRIALVGKVKNTNFVNGLDRIYKTFIGSFDQDQFTIDAFSQFYHTQTPILVDNVNKLLNLFNPFTKEDRISLRTLIDYDFINYVIQNYGIADGKALGKFRQELFYGPNSVAKELQALKNKPNKSANEKAIADNLLVQELFPLISSEITGVDNIKIFSKRYDTYRANELTDAFEELKDINFPLYNKLVRLGILQSGLNNSPITYMGLIPYETYTELSKQAFDSFEKLKGSANLDIFNQLFIRDNHTHPNVYKVAKELGLYKANLGEGYKGKDYNISSYIGGKKPILDSKEGSQFNKLSDDTQVTESVQEHLSRGEVLKSLFEKEGIVINIVETTDGESEGSVGKNDDGSFTITVSPEYVNQVSLEVLPHEYSHIWIEMLGGTKNPLVQEGIAYVKEYNPDLYKNIMDMYLKKFPNIKTSKLLKEILVTAMGQEAVEVMQNNPKGITKWKYWINRFFRKIGQLFGKPSNKARDLFERMYAGIDFTTDFEFNQENKLKSKVTASALQDSAFREQYVFFKRRIAELQANLDKYDEGSKEYNTIAAELEIIKPKFDKANREQSKELFGELGTHTLDRLEEYIKRLENDSKEDVDIELKANNIEYAVDVLKVWEEFGGTSDRVVDLAERLYPFILKYTRDDVNKFRTETDEITQDMIDSQTDDIGNFTLGVGALSDVENYYGRTIGAIIKAAQNRNSAHTKDLAKTIQEQIDLLRTWSKKNGVKESKMYDVFIQEHKGTLSLAQQYMEVVKDGVTTTVRNPNFDKIQNTKELRGFYDFYQSYITGYSDGLPIHVNANFIPNIRKSSFANTLKGLNPFKKETFHDLVIDEKLSLDQLDMKFHKKMPSDQKSKDLGNALLTFGDFSNNYGEMTSILPKLRLLQEAIKSRPNSKGIMVKRMFTKNSDPSVQVEGKDSRLFKMTDAYIKMQVLGKMKFTEAVVTVDTTYDEEGNRLARTTVNFAELADAGLKWNSLLRIGLSPITAVTNILFGDISNFIEGVGGEFYTVKNLATANNIFFKQTLNKDSWTNKLLEIINPLQELEDVGNTNKIKLKDRLSLDKVQEIMYSPQKMGEKYLQTTTMLANMLKDGLIDRKGVPTEKFNKMTPAEISKLSDKIQRLNQRIHGRYSSRDAAILQQSVVYRLLSQFRKWIPSAIENRVGAAQYDPRLQIDIEGRYKTFGKKVLGEWRDPRQAFENMLLPFISAKSALEKGEMSSTEISNMRKNLTEVLLLVGSILAYAGFKGDDDDKKWRKKWEVKLALTLLHRTSGDLNFFYSPTAINDLSKNAVPLAKLIGDLIMLVNYVPYAFEQGDYKLKKGSRKGDNKFFVKLGQVTPGLKPISDIRRIASKYELEELR